MYLVDGRYYDSAIGRFIQSASVSSLNSSSLLSLNLYVYANNNPVTYKQCIIANSMILTESFILSSVNENIVKNSNSTTSIDSTNTNLFGYEKRVSSGWEESPILISGWLGIIGYSSYTTYSEGKPGKIYVFAGRTSNTMNLLNTDYYAGIGVNAFDKINVEFQLETVGLGMQISIGNSFVSLNANLIGNTSITAGKNIDLGYGVTQSNAFTAEINTGTLVAIIIWCYKVLATGDVSPVGPVPA